MIHKHAFQNVEHPFLDVQELESLLLYFGRVSHIVDLNDFVKFN